MTNKYIYTHNTINEKTYPDIRKITKSAIHHFTTKIYANEILAETFYFLNIHDKI